MFRATLERLVEGRVVVAPRMDREASLLDVQMNISPTLIGLAVTRTESEDRPPVRLVGRRVGHHERAAVEVHGGVLLVARAFVHGKAADHEPAARAEIDLALVVGISGCFGL